MLSKTILTSACLAALTAAAPAPQVSGYTNADAPYASEIPSPIGPLATFFGDNSQAPAIPTSDTSAYPRVSSDVTG
jgi:hypothetical protein